MSDYDKIMFLFMIVSFTYFFITEHLICKIERLKEIYQLEKRIYKSRNEKAINKIQYIIDYGFDYDGFNTVESFKCLIDMLVDYARQSKDILQGSDK